MSSDRRFSEREIREVFERAAAQQQAAHQEPDGLTLEEMQEVALSAGLDPQYVASAAQSVALGEPETGRTSFGPVPTGAYRTELLPGPPTDALWTSILADVRHTFAAEGKTPRDGSLREWRNGNLRVTLEPAGTGSRLSLRTRKDSAASGVVNMGVVAVMGLIATLISLIAYGDMSAVLGWGGMFLGGAMGTGGMWAGQRSWAATRETQMEEVAARAFERSTDDAPPLHTPSFSTPAAPLLNLDALGGTPTEPARRADDQRSRA